MNIQPEATMLSEVLSGELSAESPSGDAIVMFGAVLDRSLVGKFRITVIATGFGNRPFQTDRGA